MLVLGRWLDRWWTSLLGVSPHRQDIRDRLVALPALPEADRLRVKPPLARKPRTFQEWAEQYSRRRA